MSRRFVAATETALAQLLAADLSGLDLVALMVDGIKVAEHCCVVALGITQITAWGTSYYCLGVLAGSIGRDTGWSRGFVFLGFTVALLASGGPVTSGAAGTLNVLSLWGGSEEEAFKAVLEDFTAKTGTVSLAAGTTTNTITVAIARDAASANVTSGMVVFAAQKFINCGRSG